MKNLLLFKMSVLQYMYACSDEGIEELVRDRLSFRKFCGLSLLDSVPDHTLLCKFRKKY